MAEVVANAASNNPYSVEGVKKWATHTLTYYLPTASDQAAVDAYFASIGPLHSGTFSAIGNGSEFYHVSILNALADVSRFANLNFIVASSFDQADIKFVLSSTVSIFTGTSARPHVYSDTPGFNPKDSASNDFEAFVTFQSPYELAGFDVGGAIPEFGGSSERDFEVFSGLAVALGLQVNLERPFPTLLNQFTDPGFRAFPLVSSTDHPLDNERYSVTFYERGGLDVAEARNYGHAASFSPLDIFSLQQMYGAAQNVNADDTRYIFLDPADGLLITTPNLGFNQIGRAFWTIWDTGGADVIQYIVDDPQQVVSRAYINLNDAPLSFPDDAGTVAWIKLIQATDIYKALPNEIKQDISNPEYHAGGFYSRLFHDDGSVDLGGYAIANGVVIEEADGNSGSDVLIGNESNNVLRGGGGDDLLVGAGGNDDLFGGSTGNDVLIGGPGDDFLAGGQGTDTAIFSGLVGQYDFGTDVNGNLTITHARPISGNLSDGTDTLVGVEFARFGDGYELDLSNPQLAYPATDFIFVIDGAASFRESNADQFFLEFQAMAAHFNLLDPRSEFAVVTYGDFAIEPWGKSAPYTPGAATFGLTSHPVTDFPGPVDPEPIYHVETGLVSLQTGGAAFETALISAFSHQNRGFAGDVPQGQLLAAAWAGLGLSLNLRSDSQKMIVLLTLEDAHLAADYPFIAATQQQLLGWLHSAATFGIPSVPLQPPFNANAAQADGLDPGDPDARDVLLQSLQSILQSGAASLILAGPSSVASGNAALAALLGATSITVNADGSGLAAGVAGAVAALTGDVGLTVSSFSAAADNQSHFVDAGHLITITVNTSIAANVIGAPTLQLNAGEVATYLGGSGTNALTFSYIVQPGDFAAHLQVTALNLPLGASIKDGSGDSLSGSVTGDLGLSVIGTASAALVKSANLGILRVANTDEDALTVAGEINSGQTALDTYINQLIGEAQSTTVPALITFDYFYGTTPSSGGMDFLAQFDVLLAQIGFSLLNVWVNLGASFANNGLFGPQYGAMDRDTFIDTTYGSIFGHAPTQAAHDAFKNSMDFYATFAGSELGSRGAEVGIMLYLANLDPTSNYAKSALHFLQDAAVETPAYQLPLIGTYLESNTPHLLS